MKILNIVLRIILALIISTPILGALGVFPPPTPDLYNTPEGFAFIQMLFATKFVLYIEAFVFAVAIVLIAMNRMALAALLILPVMVNIIGFHTLVDGGLFTSGAILANILLVLNAYFLWQNRAQYRSLWNKSGVQG